MQKALSAFYSLNPAIKPRALEMEQVKKYIRLYRQWNEKTNLSSISAEDEIFEKHFLDSFSLGALVEKGTLMDIGSGAGFPGLAYKILNPEIDLISVEKNAKKLAFQKIVAAELGLKNVKFINQALGEMEVQPAPDWYVFRAIEKPETILKWMGQNIKTSCGIYMASEDIKINFEKNNLQIEKIIEYTLPQSGAQRKLAVFIKK